MLESPDYYNTCAPYPVSIPDNFCGYQNSFDGNAYTGLLTYVWYTFGREIIGAELIDTMVIGNTYNISMRVSRCNFTPQSSNTCGSNKLGIRFTTFAYNTFTNNEINNQAQVYTDSILNDTINWIALVWNFVADSAYTNIYIGNFFDDNYTDTLNDGSPYAYAYYFIDSINVNCIGANCGVGLNENSMESEPEILYNSFTQSLSFTGKMLEDCQIDINNMLGQNLVSQQITASQKIDISNFKKGLYLATITINKKKVATKKIIR